MIFIRARHWWCYKVPPAIYLAALLLKQSDSPRTIFVSIAALVSVVSLVANFGYALNEIFDVAEDKRAGRANESGRIGVEALTGIAAASAIGALVTAFYFVGAVGALLTVAALTFPLAYSVPPLRLKERKWLGVVADASAAHLFPSILCILLVLRNDIFLTWGIVASSQLWAAMLGLRGIISHQILDWERDRASGLATIVHDYGPEPMMRLIRRQIGPLEIAALVATLVQAHVGAITLVVAAGYCIYEYSKLYCGWKIVLFSRSEMPYIPFLNNAWYEVWGPLVALAALALHSPICWLLPFLFAVAFWPRVADEWRMVHALVDNVAQSRTG